MPGGQGLPPPPTAQHQSAPTQSAPPHARSQSPADHAPTPGGVLVVRDLVVEFPGRRTSPFTPAPPRRAVDGVSLSLAPGEALGIVGESGCGKTTLGRAILGLIPVAQGSIHFHGRDVLAAKGPELVAIRRRMQVIFQDPGGSLDPRMRVADIIKEPLNIHAIGSAQDRTTRAAELLIRCGLPADAGTRYPHQLSGGQRQRVAIARALALRPDVVICDEPTSALDVSVQAQILNLLQELQREFSLSYILISHDLAVVAHLCRRIAVMREGKIVELAEREDLLEQPRHPYTAELLRAVPSRDFASL